MTYVLVDPFFVTLSDDLSEVGIEFLPSLAGEMGFGEI